MPLEYFDDCNKGASIDGQTVKQLRKRSKENSPKLSRKMISETRKVSKNKQK